MTDLSRRELGKFAGAAALVAALPRIASAQTNRSADLPAANGPRAVVVGGGWAGLSICKELKKQSPNTQVIMVERREAFVSHPLSNLFLIDLVTLESLTHSFVEGAKNGGYVYFNASVVDLDREKRRVMTDKGYLDYDILVLAPGVDYNYASMGVKDAEQERLLRTRYPAAFVSSAEHVALKYKIQNFKKGLFVLTAPPGIYRCAASPYERACVIAHHFKKNKIAGKVVLIDPRETPAVNGEGFVAAFNDLYGDHLEYMTSTVVEGVDPVKKTITTDFDEIEFADAAPYPRTRAAKIIERFGMMQPDNPQKEANIDPFNYNVIGDERVYVAGDCRPMPFSKSASVAMTEGLHVAKVIAARLAGKPPAAWVTPESVCYSMVDPVGKASILSESFYRFDPATKQWAFTENSKTHNARSAYLGAQNLGWGDKQFKVLFS